VMDITTTEITLHPSAEICSILLSHTNNNESYKHNKILGVEGINNTQDLELECSRQSEKPEPKRCICNKIKSPRTGDNSLAILTQFSYRTPKHSRVSHSLRATCTYMK